MKTSIYLDHAASTRLQPDALEAMLPHLEGHFGNPSGTYALGRQAARTIDNARSTVASLLGARPREILFTGPGTESINAAIKGVASAQKQAGLGDHIVTTTIEHHAVLHSCEYLEKFGFSVTQAPVDRYGIVSPDAIAEAMNERTVLVSVMLANNEIGTIEPLPEISQAVRARAKSLGRSVVLHTDAVQGANALDLNVDRLGVDLLSLSAHKFGGPKGSGVLYMRRGTPFLAQMSGGGQERQRRAGTENVASIVGLATALAEVQAQRDDYTITCRGLTTQLVEGVLRTIDGAGLTGHPEMRLPNNAHFSFEGARSDTMLDALDELGIAASAGSACNSATWEPSHVLAATGMPLRRAVGALRLTVGPENTPQEMERVLSVLPDIVAASRAATASEE
ncbi:MAG: cysteine desulfurase [Chloroflexi bacterium]|nr:cysteine desulfurase [Chloroflexota bacterium]